MNRAGDERLSKNRPVPITSPAASEALVGLRNDAIDAHRQGRPSEAVSLLRRYLAAGPDDPLAHHALALALRDLTELDGALHHIRVALELAPHDAMAKQNLGAILFASSKFEEARQAYEDVVAAQPDWALPWRNLGTVLVILGELDRGMRVLSRAVQLEPRDPWSHYHLGRAAMRLNHYRVAVAALNEALRLDPDNYGFAIALGDLYNDASDYELAERAYRHALLLRPDDIPALLGVADRLVSDGRVDEALSLLEQARSIDPREPRCLVGLGWAWRRLGEPDKAANIVREALTLAPYSLEALFLDGFLALEARDWPHAEDRFREILRRDPTHTAAGVCEAQVRLARGDYANGWPALDRRLGLGVLRYFQHVGPRWTGEPVGDRAILIEAEQGFGDTIQFIRYLPQVAARAGRVLLRVPPTLTRLLRELPANVHLVDWEKGTTSYDLRIEVMSLPRIFGTTLDTVPAEIPYLAAAPADIAAWRTRLTSSEGQLRVGLVWAGNPKHSNDANRSMPLEFFAPLMRIAGVRLYSLQVGPRSADLAGLAHGTIEDLSPYLTDFAETAAALEALDLVIAVDTSVIHLAGALGRPAWLLLSTVSEWRWMHDREDSPWYPSLRLFRQSGYRDWAELIGRVGTALEAMLRDRHRTP
jgi:Flp pilus assembly protein TadD